MGLISAICPCCGKNIDIPEATEECYCYYCGGGFVAKAAIAFAKTESSACRSTNFAKDGFDIRDGVLVKYTGRAETLFIPSTVTTIASYAFSEGDGRIAKSGSGAYVKRISIPDTVKKFERDAFSGCYALEEVRLPNGLEKIPAGLFSNYTYSLKKVHIPPLR